MIDADVDVAEIERSKKLVLTFAYAHYFEVGIPQEDLVRLLGVTEAAGLFGAAISAGLGILTLVMVGRSSGRRSSPESVRWGRRTKKRAMGYS